MEEYFIHIVSDSLGETADKVARAAAEHFGEISYKIIRHTNIVTVEAVDEVLGMVRAGKSIVIFTIVAKEARKRLIEVCRSENIEFVDVLDPVLAKMQHFFGTAPSYEVGALHKLDERYYKKVEALEFAVKYDDGKDPRGILLADVVIVGISRTSKTPLCMYLAMKNLKVTNVPLVPEVKLPDELFMIPRSRIIGLTNDPNRLIEIREERLKSLGLKPGSHYADSERIKQELYYADSVMRMIGCTVIDVSNKAIEETAMLIEKVIYSAI